jgi:hypothetical protein
MCDFDTLFCLVEILLKGQDSKVAEIDVFEDHFVVVVDEREVRGRLRAVDGSAIDNAFRFGE